MIVELPKDADGREIPLDTEVLYDKEGKRREVDWYTFYPDKYIWDVVLADSSAHFSPRNLSLTQPDSWEKLEEDLRRGADALNYESCAYFGKSACDCSSCIADKGKTCERVVMRDIADRIRKLRSADE